MSWWIVAAYSWAVAALISTIALFLQRRYGLAPLGGDRVLTEVEIWTVVLLGVPILVFLMVRYFSRVLIVTSIWLFTSRGQKLAERWELEL